LNSKILNKGLVIVLVLTVVFYAGFLFYGDLNSIGELFFQINFWFIPLILIFRFFAIILRSFRQKLFLQSLGIKISTKFNTLVYIAGLSMLVSPASTGTVIKSYLLNKKFGTEYSKTIPIVITEKYHDILAPISIISIMLIFIDVFEVRLIAVILSIIILAIYVFTRKKNLLQKIIHKTSKIKILNKFQENFLDHYDSIHTLSDKKPLIYGWLIGIFATLIDGVGIYLGFVALGIDFTFIESFVLVYLPSIIGVISLVPGGFGISETGMLGLFVQFGLPISIATTAVLFTRLTGIWFSFAIGAITNIFYLKFLK